MKANNEYNISEETVRTILEVDKEVKETFKMDESEFDIVEPESEVELSKTDELILKEALRRKANNIKINEKYAKPTVYLNPEKLKILKEKSARRGIRINTLINQALKFWTDGYCDIKKIIDGYHFSSSMNVNKTHRFPLAVEKEFYKEVKKKLKANGVSFQRFAERILDRWYESPESDIRVILKDYPVEIDLNSWQDAADKDLQRKERLILKQSKKRQSKGLPEIN